MKEQVLDQLNLYIWAKDKNYRYVFCNENYAKAAGIDSPQQLSIKLGGTGEIIFCIAGAPTRNGFI